MIRILLLGVIIAMSAEANANPYEKVAATSFWYKIGIIKPPAQKIIAQVKEDAGEIGNFEFFLNTEISEGAPGKGYRTLVQPLGDISVPINSRQVRDLLDHFQNMIIDAPTEEQDTPKYKAGLYFILSLKDGSQVKVGIVDRTKTDKNYSYLQVLDRDEKEVYYTGKIRSTPTPLEILRISQQNRKRLPMR